MPSFIWSSPKYYLMLVLVKLMLLFIYYGLWCRLTYLQFYVGYNWRPPGKESLVFWVTVKNR